MNKEKVILDILQKSYEETIKYRTSLNGKANFELTSISLLLSFILLSFDLVESTDSFYLWLSILFLICVLCLIATMIVVLVSRFSENYDRLPGGDTLIKDIENVEEEKVVSEEIKLYKGLIEDSNEQNKKKLRMLRVSDILLLISLSLLIIYVIFMGVCIWTRIRC